MRAEKNLIIERAILSAGSQAKLAEKTNLSQNAINKLLHRKSADMLVSTLVSLSKATGIDKDEIILSLEIE